MNPLTPAPVTLAKLGSIIVHAEEAASTHGHYFDRIALETLLEDADVVAWLKGMRELALIPVRRREPGLAAPITRGAIPHAHPKKPIRR
jgi:hypothetical protein